MVLNGQLLPPRRWLCPFPTPALSCNLRGLLLIVKTPFETFWDRRMRNRKPPVSGKVLRFGQLSHFL